MVGRAAGDHRPHLLHQRSPAVFPLLDAVAGERQRLVQHRRLLPLRLGEVDVARAHRKPVRLADGRTDHDIDMEAEVGGHPPDDGQLLRVLLAEDRDMGLDGIEELRDDRRHSAEMSGPHRPLEHRGQLLHMHGCLESRRVHFAHRRSEHVLRSRVRRGHDILRERPGVALEILTRSELEGVDEDRRHHDVGVLPRQADERQVAGVQRPHRRDDRNALPLAAQRVGREVHARDRLYCNRHDVRGREPDG